MLFLLICGLLVVSGDPVHPHSWSPEHVLPVEKLKHDNLSATRLLFWKTQIYTSFLFNWNLLILSFYLLTVEVFNPDISLFIRISWRNIFLFLFVLFFFIDFCELKHSDSCWTSSQGTVVQFYLNLLTVSSWTVYQRHVWGFLTSLFFYRSFWFNSNLLMRSLSPHWLWIILLSAHLFIHSWLKSHFYIFVYCCLLFWWFSFIYDIYKFFLFRFKDQKGGNLTFMVEFYTQFL